MNKIIAGVILLMSLCTSVQAQDYIQYTFRVEGTCGMCQDRIENVAINEGKAHTASWDQDSKILIVEIDETISSISAIKYYLAQAGHDNGSGLATE